MAATSARTTGTLFIVATPIGNRDDITFRALETLKSVDIILAEDTRHTSHLLTSFGIKKPLQSMHAHNENDKSIEIIQQLLLGRSFALVSDAGTPIISDPGFPLVNLAKKNNINVVPIPGACAFISALSASGIPCDELSFFGFLPAKHSARYAKLSSLKNINHTLIFYESTHRIMDFIKDASDIFGSTCQMVLAKELTKTYERIIAGTILEIENWLKADAGHIKGEFVVIIPPREISEAPNNIKEVLEVLLGELPLKQAVKLACVLTKSAKNDVYQLALNMQGRV